MMKRKNSFKCAHLEVRMITYYKNIERQNPVEQALAKALGGVHNLHQKRGDPLFRPGDVLLDGKGQVFELKTSYTMEPQNPNTTNGLRPGSPTYNQFCFEVRQRTAAGEDVPAGPYNEGITHFCHLDVNNNTLYVFAPAELCAFLDNITVHAIAWAANNPWDEAYNHSKAPTGDIDLVNVSIGFLASHIDLNKAAKILPQSCGIMIAAMAART
jgi:hypothetical protein